MTGSMKSERRIARTGTHAPEQGPAAILGNTCSLEVGIHVLLRRVVGGSHVVPAPLLVKTEERARTLRVVIPHPTLPGRPQARGYEKSSLTKCAVGERGAFKSTSLPHPNDDA